MLTNVSPSLKILLLTNKVPYPANDGSSIAMASMVDGFLKNGASVTLLSLNTRKHFKDEGSINSEIPANLNFYKVDVNTDVHAVGAAVNLISGQPYHVSRFYQKRYAAKLKSLLQSESFDIVQIEGLSMAVYYDLVKSLSKAPVVLRAHNVEHQIWERHINNQKDFFQKRYLQIQVKRLKKFELDAFAKMDAIVAITEEDESGIIKLAPTLKTISIPCGIDLKKTKPDKHAHGYQSDIGYLASFDWMPNVQGVEWFLDSVWPILKKQRPDITFRLGGRHMPNHFHNLKEDGISIHPDVPDMAEFVCGSRLAVIPLLAGSGMRIKIIENMALGKCQVSTTIGAEGVKVENGHDILLADTPEEFARQIFDALSSPERVDEIGANARITIEENYGNEALGKRLINFYENQLC